MKKIKIVLIRGDGIGPEVADAVRTIFDAVGLPLEWISAEAGISVIKREPGGLPEETLELIREHGLALKGPTTTPIGKGHQSVNVLIRKRLGLYANVRPAKSLQAVKTRFPNVDLMIVRENIEDTYGGIEHMQSARVAQGLKLMSELAAERSIRHAFELARREERKEVTCVHKANIHKLTDGLFLRVFNRVKQDFEEIRASDILVDNACMQLVRNPEVFDTLVMPNLYGDILSDLCAGLVGGLGVAPAGNIGNGVAVFEAVHGSAPDIAGKGLANPTALFLSGLMLLRHLGLGLQADLLFKALSRTFERKVMTADLGGSASTGEFTEAIIECARDESFPKIKGISFLRSSVERIHLDSSDVSSELVGVDIFVRSSGYPESAPHAVGPLSLTRIYNRGTPVFDSETEADRIDVYCLRYRSSKELESGVVTGLLAEFDTLGIEWVHVEKLHLVEGREAFT